AYTLATNIIGRTHLLSSLITDNTPESISKQENLQEILSYVHEFVEEKNEQGEQDHNRMTDFLAEVSLATDQDDKDTSEQRVTLMTVHAAKGLEFNNVVIVGVEEELFPSVMSSDSIGAIEEERRLLYVAITRARNFCMISYSSSRFKNGQTKMVQPSRFLRDIDPKYLRPIQGTDLSFDERGANPYENYRSSFHSHSLIDPQPQSPARPAQAASRWQPRPVETRPAAAPAEDTPGGLSFSLHTADEVAPGMEIMHERFRKGQILEVETGSDAKITVMFAMDRTRRKLMLKFAKFAILPTT
ncbi:MAG: ATP-binding domain-containing protein, partial [Muribaculaceae bacterium]|nr:ATP-binding domain-containing protein [Muribaculaceae bacterium]